MSSMNNLTANISPYAVINNNTKKIANNNNNTNPVNNNNCKNVNPEFKADKLQNSNIEFKDIKNEISMRNLCPSDIIDLKELCADWFPVE